MIENKLVSVLVLVYNHEICLKDALDGILMQKTNFDYEIVVGEDCSTDNSRKILIDYSERYQNKFKLLLPEKNIGAMANQLATMNACIGKYIAICEGDDYWTDPYKLQKQVDFLEANEDFSICFHNVQVKHDDDSFDSYLYCGENQKDVSSYLDLAYENYIPTCSCLFRNNLTRQLDFLTDLKIGDWVLHILNAQTGKIKYLSDVMGVYRIHGQSYWSSQSLTKRIEILLPIYDSLLKRFCDDTEFCTALKEGKQKYLDMLIVQEKVDDVKIKGSYVVKVKRKVFKYYRLLKASPFSINFKKSLYGYPNLFTIGNKSFLKIFLILNNSILVRFINVLTSFKIVVENKTISNVHEKNATIKREVEIKEDDINAKELIFTCYFVNKKDLQNNNIIRQKADIEYIYPWYNSIVNLKLKGIVFHDGLDEGFITKYENEFVQFRKCTLGNYSIYEERWIIFYIFLKQTKIKNAFFCDIQDVYIKSNPFLIVDSKRKLYVGRDNANRIHLSDWMLYKLSYFQQNTNVRISPLFFYQPVYNPGVIGGSKKILLFTILKMIKLSFLSDVEDHEDMTHINLIIYKYFRTKLSNSDMLENTDVLSDKDSSHAYLKTGYPLNSEYKKYELNSNACFIHK